MGGIWFSKEQNAVASVGLTQPLAECACREVGLDSWQRFDHSKPPSASKGAWDEQNAATPPPPPACSWHPWLGGADLRHLLNSNQNLGLCISHGQDVVQGQMLQFSLIKKGVSSGSVTRLVQSPPNSVAQCNGIGMALCMGFGVKTENPLHMGWVLEETLQDSACSVLKICTQMVPPALSFWALTVHFKPYELEKFFLRKRMSAEIAGFCTQYLVPSLRWYGSRMQASWRDLSVSPKILGCSKWAVAGRGGYRPTESLVLIQQ